MRNTYPGNCFICHQPVPAGAGWFQLNKIKKRVNNKRGSAIWVPLTALPDKWLLRCTDCKDRGNTPDPPLTTTTC